MHVDRSKQPKVPEKLQPTPILQGLLKDLLLEVSCSATLQTPVGTIFPQHLAYDDGRSDLLLHCKTVQLVCGEHQVLVAPIIIAGGVAGAPDTYGRAEFGEPLQRAKAYFTATPLDEVKPPDPRHFLRSCLDNVGRYCHVHWLGEDRPGRKPWLVGVACLTEYQMALDPSSRILLIGVMDEGVGIEDPRRCAVDGYTGCSGQGYGFGGSLRSMDFSLFVSSDGKLFLFDRRNLEPQMEPDGVLRTPAKVFDFGPFFMENSPGRSLGGIAIGFAAIDRNVDITSLGESISLALEKLL